MSDRLTEEWTKTTAEAFGDTEYTRKGKRAEEIILEHFSKVYDFAHLNEEDKQLQVDGKDITFGYHRWSRGYNVDVKSNLNNYKFSVDIPKLLKSKTDRWLHLDMETMWYAMYDINDMKNYLRKIEVINKPYQYIETAKNKRPDFINMGQVK
jgi:hypothetical protein